MDASKSYLTPTKSRYDQQCLAYRRYDRPSLHYTSTSSYSMPYDCNRSGDLPTSTPCVASRSTLHYSTSPKKHDSHVLDRVDRYLAKCSIDEKRVSDSEMRTSMGGGAIPKKMVETSSAQQIQRYEPKPTEDDILNSLTSNKMSDWSTGLHKSMTKEDNPLINLASVWDGNERGKSEAATLTTTTKTTMTTDKLQEQELRIRQYERTIQNLQTQLKQYQNKCSDAIKMDQTKNEALARLHESNSRWVLMSENTCLWICIRISFFRFQFDLEHYAAGESIVGGWAQFPSPDEWFEGVDETIAGREWTAETQNQRIVTVSELNKIPNRNWLTIEHFSVP